MLQHTMRHTMCHSKLPVTRMCINIGVEPSPILFLLQATIIGDSIKIRLVGRTSRYLPAILLHFHMTRRLHIGSMPVERLIHKGDASIQLGTNGKTPIIHNLIYPILGSLDKLTPQEHRMSSKATEEQGFQRILWTHQANLSPICATQMGGKTKVMLPNRLHLLGDFLRKPHVILVADSHKIP